MYRVVFVAGVILSVIKVVFWYKVFVCKMSTKKRITELTVLELRTQLGKRGVDTTGDRPALISRLKKVSYRYYSIRLFTYLPNSQL